MLIHSSPVRNGVIVGAGAEAGEAGEAGGAGADGAKRAGPTFHVFSPLSLPHPPQTRRTGNHVTLLIYLIGRGAQVAKERHIMAPTHLHRKDNTANVRYCNYSLLR
jgi:hypothetical protein